jgi:hypothetical protein
MINFIYTTDESLQIDTPRGDSAKENNEQRTKQEQARKGGVYPAVWLIQTLRFYAMTKNNYE